MRNSIGGAVRRDHKDRAKREKMQGPLADHIQYPGSVPILPAYRLLGYSAMIPASPVICN